MKKLEDYKLVIWDLDGTLYFQNQFRIKMATVLLKGLVLRPSKWREAFVILKYRKIREHWDPKDCGKDLEMRQYEMTAKSFGIDATEVENIIFYWMHKEPLKYLIDSRDEEAVVQIQELRKKGILNVVYSDYPTKEKMAALQIVVDDDFASTDKEIGSMKPNPGGIEYILKKYKIEKKDAVMVGDRMKKDGLAAEAAGIDYLILSKKKKERENQYHAGIEQG